jgi:DNA polymerase alpha subunit A
LSQLTSKQLGKDPKDYPNGMSMPSVQVGLKLLARGKHVKAKDVMSYVITGESSGSAEAAARNAYPLEDVMKTDSGLKVDVDYYLHKQILPPVERLCAPISGTNVTQLADCLGLDTSKYRVSTVSGSYENAEEAIQPLESQIPDAIRFKDATALFLRCRACKTVSTFRGLAASVSLSAEERASAAQLANDGFKCPVSSCGTYLTPLSVAAQLDCQVKAHIARYYAGWLVCDEPTCGQRTRQMCVYGHRCLGPKGLASGCVGTMRPEYGERALYNQLLYLGSMFDSDRTKEKMTKETGIDEEEREKFSVVLECNRERFTTWKGAVNGYLDRNGRQWVQMDSLFGFTLKTTA